MSYFSELSEIDKTLVSKFISKKCSEYHFIDFINATNGNVEDAIELFKLDEKLRVILLKYSMRFEIHVKNLFVASIEKSTNCNRFWDNANYYMESALKTDCNNRSLFSDMIRKIKTEMKNLGISSFEYPDYAAVGAMSYGTFVCYFSQIKLEYKQDFINQLTAYLPIHNFQILNKYLLAVKVVRNRCAHGGHIITMQLTNQLNNYKFISKNENMPTKDYQSIFELTLHFMIQNLCTSEMRKQILALLKRYQDVYTKYTKKLSIKPLRKDNF